MTQPAPRLPNLTPTHLARATTLLRLLQKLSPRLAARVAFWLFLRPQRRDIAHSDVAFMGTAKMHLLRIGNDRVQVYEWGSGTRTVLIAHGWSSRAARFAPLAAALAARGWRVLAFDAPGHGHSAGRSSSLLQFMSTMDVIATKLGPVQALIGHSLGALAIAGARQGEAPPWLSSVQKVVLLSLPSGVPFLVDAFHRMFSIGTATSVHLHGHFKRRFGDPATFVAKPAAAIRQLPTLIVHDRNDDIVPFAHGEALLPELTKARLLATEGLGHSALTRDAATIVAIAAFLDEDIA
jgi:pimeloyl-ACP methyl ester carboxylesterase